jgi:hypothetical protein
LNPLPSTDLHSKATAKGVVVAQSYIFATTPEFKYLDMLLKMLAPKEYKKGTATAGRWYTKQTEGCTLGLTTTWKVQVCLHLDRGIGNCAWFSAGEISLGRICIFLILTSAWCELCGYFFV